MDKEHLLNLISDDLTKFHSLSDRTLGLIIRELGGTHDYKTMRVKRKDGYSHECWCRLPQEAACHHPNQILEATNEQ